MSAAPLTGQVAVVTGASRGIGKAIAVHLARQGARVAGIARAGPDLGALPREADGAAGRLLAFAADVTSAGEVEAAFARVDADLGTPQLVVACAGTADVIGPLWLADPQQWWQAVAVDLRGTMLTAQCAISRMLAAGGGRLVTIYGNLGDRQQGYVSAFAVAKGRHRPADRGVAGLRTCLRTQGPRARRASRLPCAPRNLTRAAGLGRAGPCPGCPASVNQPSGDGADAQPAADLITASSPALGAADQLTGRILHPRDDLSALTRQCQSQPGRRRLRLDLS